MLNHARDAAHIRALKPSLARALSSPRELKRETGSFSGRPSKEPSLPPAWIVAFNLVLDDAEIRRKFKENVLLKSTFLSCKNFDRTFEILYRNISHLLLKFVKFLEMQKQLKLISKLNQLVTFVSCLIDACCL
jgi:hypothetical protein